MKKNICRILIFFLFFLFHTLYSADKKINPGFVYKVDVLSFPVYYEHSLESISMDFYGDMFFGVQLKSYSFGLRPYCNYQSINSSKSNKHFKGAYFAVGGLLDHYVSIGKWVELSFGLGGHWHKDAFQNEEYIYSSQYVGGKIFFNSQFFLPWKYMDFVLLNDLNLMVPVENLTEEKIQNFYSDLYPNYSGGLRVNFHPYFTWLSLYIQATGVYWFYTNEIVKINTGMFKGGIGVQVSINTNNFRKNKSKEKVNKILPLLQESAIKQVEAAPQEEEKIAEQQQEPEHVPEPVIEKKPEPLVSPLIKKFMESESREKIKITEIIFETEKADLNEKAISILNEIGQYLRENEIGFSISGYSKNHYNPFQEQEIAEKRAGIIREHLINLGVKENLLKISQSFTLLNEQENADQARGIIIFEKL